MSKTFILSKQFITQNWYIINAENQILGRFASQISQLLLNKYSSIYTPFLTPITNIILINSDKIVISGQKNLKKYLTYSGYQGGLKFKTFLQIKASNSEKLLRHAIRGMLSKNQIGRNILSKVYIYRRHNDVHFSPKSLLLAFFKNK